VIHRGNSEKDRAHALVDEIEFRLDLVRQRAKAHPHILAPLVDISHLITDLKSEVERADEASNWGLISNMLMVAFKLLESINGK